LDNGIGRGRGPSKGLSSVISKDVAAGGDPLGSRKDREKDRPSMLKGARSLKLKEVARLKSTHKRKLRLSGRGEVEEKSFLRRKFSALWLYVGLSTGGRKGIGSYTEDRRTKSGRGEKRERKSLRICVDGFPWEEDGRERRSKANTSGKGDSEGESIH